MKIVEETHSLPFINFSKLLLYLLSDDLKSYSITSSASSLIIISMLSLFEYITRCASLSSLERKK